MQLRINEEETGKRDEPNCLCNSICCVYLNKYGKLRYANKIKDSGWLPFISEKKSERIAYTN